MTDRRFYIVDMNHNYYKIDENGQLVVAKNSDEATTFSIKEANSRIGTGRRAKFYQIIEVPEIVMAPKTTKTFSGGHLFMKENQNIMFDSLQNNWEELLSKLCYMCNHVGEYQDRLNDMLSDVDQEISDILHYIEFNDLSDKEMVTTGKMLQERRRHRREIKDEMEKTALMRETFLDHNFAIKVQQSLDLMVRMKDRYYTPRKLRDLFNVQTQKVPA